MPRRRKKTPLRSKSSISQNCHAGDVDRKICASVKSWRGFLRVYHLVVGVGRPLRNFNSTRRVTWFGSRVTRGSDVVCLLSILSKWEQILWKRERIRRFLSFSEPALALQHKLGNFSKYEFPKTATSRSSEWSLKNVQLKLRDDLNVLF